MINRRVFGGDEMKYCPLCEKIKEVRERQGRNYYEDLCDDCKKIYLKREERKKQLILG